MEKYMQEYEFKMQNNDNNRNSITETTTKTKTVTKTNDNITVQVLCCVDIVFTPNLVFTSSVYLFSTSQNISLQVSTVYHQLKYLDLRYRLKYVYSVFMW